MESPHCATGRSVAPPIQPGGRQFLSETLSLLAGGLFVAVGAAARAPIRITPDILDDAGRFLGQKNAGANAPLFSSWLSKADNLAEIMPGGQVRYTTTITDPASSLNGRSVSVSHAGLDTCASAARVARAGGRATSHSGPASV